MKHTFDWNGARITLDSLTVRDRNHKSAIYARIANKLNVSEQDDLFEYDIIMFADFVVSVKAIEGDFPMPLLNANHSVDEYIEAFNVWLELPESFTDAYNAGKAIVRVMSEQVPVEKKADSDQATQST